MQQNTSLFDHLVGGRAASAGGQAERLGGFQIDHQFEFSWLLDWQVSRFRPFQNPVDVPGGALAQSKYARPIRQQAPCLDEFPRLMNGGQAVTVSQVGDLLEMDGEGRSLLDYERVGRLFLMSESLRRSPRDAPRKFVEPGLTLAPLIAFR